MADSGTTFDVVFRAQMRELRNAMSEVKKLQAETAKAAKEQFKLNQKLDKERHKAYEKQQKQFSKDRKEEINHIKAVHALKLKNIRQSVQAAGGAGVGGGGSGSVQNRRQGGGGSGPPNQPGTPGGGSQSQRGFFRNITGKALSIGGYGLTGLLGMLVGGAYSGYQRYLQYGTALGGTIGLAPSGGAIRRGIRGAPGSRLGYSVIDTAEQVPMMARATGVVGPRELQQAMRSTGLQAGEAGEVFQAIRQGGTSFAGGEQRGSSAGAREFKKMIAAGMESGLEHARLPEFFHGVTALAQQRGGMAAGTVDMSSFAKQLAMFGKTGLAGFQGQRGAALATKLNQAFITPGGDEWGENFIRQAMGFGNPGGNGVSFYEAEKRRERGMADPANMQRLMGEVGKQFGTGPEGALALRSLAGVSLEQAEELFKIYNNGEDTNAQLEKIDQVMEEGKSIEERSLNAMKNIGGVVKRIAGRTDEMAIIGAKVAPVIEQIEDWQIKLLNYLIDIASKIGRLVEQTDELLDWFSGGKSNRQRAREAILRSREMYTKMINASPQERARLRQQQVQEAEEAMRLVAVTSDERRALVGAQIPNVENPGVTGSALTYLKGKYLQGRQDAISIEDSASRAKLQAQYFDNIMNIASSRGIKLDSTTAMALSQAAVAAEIANKGQGSKTIDTAMNSMQKKTHTPVVEQKTKVDIEVQTPNPRARPVRKSVQQLDSE